MAEWPIYYKHTFKISYCVRILNTRIVCLLLHKFYMILHCL